MFWAISQEAEKLRVILNAVRSASLRIRSNSSAAILWAFCDARVFRAEALRWRSKLSARMFADIDLQITASSDIRRRPDTQQACFP